MYRRDWPDERVAGSSTRKRQMVEWPCFSPPRSLNRSSCIHWEASARMSSSTRHPAGSGFIEKSRTAGYLYLYGQLFNRTLKSADSTLCRPRENSQRRLVFHTKLSTFALFATISTAPPPLPSRHNLFSLPPEPLLDFPPLTQPFKTTFKKAGILLSDRKKE